MGLINPRLGVQFSLPVPAKDIMISESQDPKHIVYVEDGYVVCKPTNAAITREIFDLHPEAMVSYSEDPVIVWWTANCVWVKYMTRKGPNVH